jgi:hypothetical protein
MERFGRDNITINGALFCISLFLESILLTIDVPYSAQNSGVYSDVGSVCVFGWFRPTIDLYKDTK